MFRGPIKGTLSDADVKSLIVRAARTTSVSELHELIRLFVMNRVALVQVIESLTAEIGKAKPSVTSQFDMALLEQLKVVRAELDSANERGDAAEARDRASAEKLTRLERTHDAQQRLAERLHRELWVANTERERLGAENSELSAKLTERTAELQAVSKEVIEVRARLIQTATALNNAIIEGRSVYAERDSLLAQLAESTGDVEHLKAQLASTERRAKHLKDAVKRHVYEMSNQRKLTNFLQDKVTRLEFEHNHSTPTAAAPSVVSSTNVVAFANSAELAKLREQIRTQAAAMAAKDQTISQLQGANGSLKGIHTDSVKKQQQMESDLRAQGVANESIAATLLGMLPPDQREIFSVSAYDGSSVMLIASALKRHNDDVAAERHYKNDEFGRSM
jgi:chromosome segregation ATPase